MVISEITNIITAAATVFMAWVAWVALNTWRKELIGKNKIELACQIMTTVYDFQDVLISARIDRIAGQEIKEVEEWMNSEKAKDPQHTNIYPDRFHFLVPQYRLREKQEEIDAFKLLANKACLYWGAEIFALFHELSGYTLKIRTAAKDLYYNDTPQNPPDLIKIIYYSGSDDAITKRVNDIVEEFRINLEPIYKDQQTSWKKLK